MGTTGASLGVAGAGIGEESNFPRLKEDDKRQFDVHTTIQALKIPKDQSGRCLRELQGLLYQRPGVKRVERCDEHS